MPVERLAEAAVELARAAEQRELELVVRAPAEVVGLHDDVLDRAVDVEHRDALADPFLVHHLGGMRPDFEVVRLHEVLADPVAEHRVDELLEVLRGLVVALGLRFDQAGQAFVASLPSAGSGCCSGTGRAPSVSNMRTQHSRMLSWKSLPIRSSKHSS